MQDISTFVSNHLGLSYAFAIVLVLLLIVEALRAKRNTLNIDVSKAIQLINRENAVVIDIRSTAQYQNGHILDALPIPSSELHVAGKKIEKYKNKPIIIVCAAGVSSQKAAASLIKQGYNAYSLIGGIKAWGEANMPIIK